MSTNFHTQALRAALWDDNPATVDVLGFDIVVSAVNAALRHEGLDPITIGVHAPWGGGKSTVLSLLEAAADPEWVVVRTNPWEYDDQLDPKGTLISEILTALQTEASKDDRLKERVAGRIKSFKDRISWSRFGIAMANGLLTMQWDPDQILKAFNPDSEDGPQSLAKFREEFAKLLTEMPDTTRVVVLVDDLDRCLPDAVMATLEAIKLFLSVEKMAFVIAADQDMVSHAIGASLQATNRSEIFADRYLEKIVQLPISLPRLSPVEAEAYIGLLLAHADLGDDGFADLVGHVNERRRSSKAPLLDEFGELPKRPSEETLRLASQLAQGLGPERVASPREIKRFLNAYGVRSQMAAQRGVSIGPAVLVKLLLLEDRHRRDFERLALHDDRASLMREWEAWAKADDGEPPAGVRPETREWARSEPSIAEEPIDSYITMAATLAAAQLSAGINDELRGLVRRVLGDSEADRGVAIGAVAERSIEDQRQVVGAIVIEGRRADTTDPAVRALVALGVASSALLPDIAADIGRHFGARLDPSGTAELAESGVTEFVDLLRRLVAEDALSPESRTIADGLLEGI